MKPLSRTAFATLLGCSIALAASCICFTTPAPAAEPAKAKNWTAPAYKNKAQVLSDRIMATHPELLSVTFHGIPPGMKDTYTMFAGCIPSASAIPTIRTISTS